MVSATSYEARPVDRRVRAQTLGNDWRANHTVIGPQIGSRRMSCSIRAPLEMPVAWPAHSAPMINTYRTSAASKVVKKNHIEADPRINVTPHQANSRWKQTQTPVIE